MKTTNDLGETLINDSGGWEVEFRKEFMKIAGLLSKIFVFKVVKPKIYGLTLSFAGVVQEIYIYYSFRFRYKSPGSTGHRLSPNRTC